MPIYDFEREDTDPNHESESEYDYDRDCDQDQDPEWTSEEWVEWMKEQPHKYHCYTMEEWSIWLNNSTFKIHGYTKEEWNEWFDDNQILVTWESLDSPNKTEIESLKEDMDQLRDDMKSTLSLVELFTGNNS